MTGDDIVTARQGDTLDGLLWRERGLTVAAITAVLAVNPGLARLGAILPLGTAVTVPAAAPVTATRPLVNLWD